MPAGSATPARSPGGPSAIAVPGREPERDRDDRRRRSTSASVVATVTAEPGQRRERRGSTVLWVAYRPRASRWPERVERDGERERREHRRRDARRPRRRTRRRRAAPRSRAGRRSTSPIAAAIVQDADRERVASGRAARTPARSPAAQTADRAGNAASEMATPISATGTLWKLRAKLTAVTRPGRERRGDAGEEQERERLDRVAEHLGHHQPQELAEGRHPEVAAGTGSRTVERVMPTTRIPRWSDAPMTAPTAAAVIPIRSWSSTVPGHDPDVVEDRREGVEQEPPLGDEDLAQRDRRREQDRREQHEPEQVEVAAPASRRRSPGR